MIINSSDNGSVKELRKLSKKKYRNQTSTFIIETKKMIDEALRSNINIINIFIREDQKNNYDNATILSKNLFDELSTLVTPDGYMAIVEKPTNKDVDDKVLILDQIQDPGNMGTLIRSAEAFGFNTIMSIKSCDFYNEKVLRATMGSIFRLNLIDSNYDDIKNLKNYDIYIADMSGKDYREVLTFSKIALVIGNEGKGISDEIQQIDHLLLKIPMQGDIESLNAGVSGSILMSKFS